MTEFISRDAAICIADYAVDEHPYDKNPEQPETYSDYNQGWNDACDYIQARLENAEKVDVAPVRHGRGYRTDEMFVCAGLVEIQCSECEETNLFDVIRYKTSARYCPYCGAKWERGDNDEK